MAELQHSQIRQKLQEQVIPHLDASDIKDGPGKADHLLSRAIAAVCIRILADAEIEAASQAVVDGANDNGIDAIYYDPTTATLILVQSKWNNSHGGSIDSAGVLKFVQGARDLISQKKDRFNEKVQDRWATIEDALGRVNSVVLVLGYSGSGPLDSFVSHSLQEFVDSQNDTGDMFSFEVISQKQLFQYFVHEAAPPQIDLTVRLSHYGLVETPLQAVYGQVSANDVADWYRKYGNNLFAQNIRNFLGLKSEVNTAIAKSLVEAPANFWYFNNGLTILAEKMKKQAIGGADRSVGIFDCSGVTVVNGAQTVGTIGRTLVGGSEAALQARIIIVDDPNSLMGQLITRASNTQNRIDARNFVALDPQQERIRTELLVSGVNYEYREGETPVESADGFDFIEGIIALACASGEISYVALAKGYVGGLYADINETPYKALFNAGTSSKRLWSLVLLGRRIDTYLRKNHDQSSPTVRGTVVHGNRFLMHCILKDLEKIHPHDGGSTFTDQEVESSASSMLNKIDTVVQADYSDAYLARLFKNVSKCTAIKAKVL
ncbi:AIPR family protein [Mesorhizobium sp. B2-4-17]|uniref:AIPR family protein n=1 Tax=Mesorhizobium sp. B2-4-17 TaxID=2589932 RepID=UPI00112B4019|nr:AIPR family protein [Mesorhizobium sp. B2-4-17]TPK79125.1 AIPR family protein [Mesorhizobium sp. B2-4-17]